MNSRPAELLVVCLLGMVPPAIAADAGGGAEEAAPTPELLEFLGAWETPEGQWVDPISLLGVADEGTAGGSMDTPHPAGGLPGRAPPDSRVKRHDETHR